MIGGTLEEGEDCGNILGALTKSLFSFLPQ